jgi:hypothetical protein
LVGRNELVLHRIIDFTLLGIIVNSCQGLLDSILFYLEEHKGIGWFLQVLELLCPSHSTGHIACGCDYFLDCLSDIGTSTTGSTTSYGQYYCSKEEWRECNNNKPR